MKVELEPNFYAYEYRGLFTVVDRCKYPEQELSESFLHELTKQLSPVMVEKLNRNVSYIKRKGGEFWINQYLRDGCVWVIDDIVYLYVNFLLCGFGTYFWCICRSDEGSIDPHAVTEAERSHLHFEIVSTLPDKVKPIVFEYLLKWASEAESEDKKQHYIELYEDRLHQERFDDWLPKLQEIITWPKLS